MRLPSILVCVGALAAPAFLLADGTDGADAPADLAPAEAPPRMPEVHERVLSNGMRFLLVRRPDAPIFHGIVVFRVGGVDEDLGATGLAHMFEHMAFKGTRAIGTRDWAKEKPLLESVEKAAGELTRLRAAGGDPERIQTLAHDLEDLQRRQAEVIDPTEFQRIYAEAGQRGLNAFTAKDVTAYHVSLPSNRLELWMLMESERLRDPVLREFYTERDVVCEERRTRSETSPPGVLMEHLLTASFLAHPYRMPTIGWMQDIQGLTTEAARDFYAQHYSPDNAVGALVGDFQVKDAGTLLERYFGRIPRRGAPPARPVFEPPQRGERRIEVRLDAEPRLMMSFHKPTAPDPDDTVAELLATLLGGGPTSRLHRRLVQKDRLAAAVSASNGLPGMRYENLFYMSAVPLRGHTTAECEAAIAEEVARVAAEGVTEAELARVRAREEVSLLGQMTSNEDLAHLLALNQGIVGDWREPWAYLARMRRVTSEDVKAFAARWLVPENRTVATLLQAKPAGGQHPQESGK